MDMPFDLPRSVGDLLTVRRVFGEPVERDGTTVIPVARVLGGGGGGFGEEGPGVAGGPGPRGRASSGSGGGLGSVVRPLGVYVIRDGEVSWRPTVDVDRVVLGGQLVGALAIVALAAVLRRRQR